MNSHFYHTPLLKITFPPAMFANFKSLNWRNEIILESLNHESQKVQVNLVSRFSTFYFLSPSPEHQKTQFSNQ